jgi:hypothetical protein
MENINKLMSNNSNSTSNNNANEKQIEKAIIDTNSFQYA